MLNTQQKQALIEQAIKARDVAYAPYSHYHVGAALLAANGEVFIGCNVENAAFPATICAERTAVVKAVSAGQQDFVAIAIATVDGGSPCGICRQVLNEFAPTLHVIITNDEGEIVLESSLDQLLPYGFGPSHLKTEK
ncbi:MAG: cytidine deaminase [Phototrophicales bacterium]|nr:MAG: cytidine deaminase [Phototrophicales bacterium]